MSYSVSPGSLVLITGANGFIGSHIIDAFLAAGFNVRGTVRDAAKADILDLKQIWAKKYPDAKFETVEVKDLFKEDALPEADLQGVSAIVHVASDLTFSSDPEKVIQPVITATVGILRTAAKTPSIKRVVLTSSSDAAIGTAGVPTTRTGPIPDHSENITAGRYDLDEKSWNDRSVQLARTLLNDDPSKGVHVYSASKTLGEQAAWKFVKEEKPSFGFISILPNINFGPVLSKKQAGSTSGFLPRAYKDNDFGLMDMMGPRWFIDVRDVASLHVAAVTKDAAVGKRVWAATSPYNTNDLRRTFHELRPDNDVFAHPPVDDGNELRDMSLIDNRLGRELLGRDWISFKESIKANIEGI